MDKNKVQKFTNDLVDFHHVILALCGAVCLLLPDATNMDKEHSRAMFIAALVLLGYSTVVGCVLQKRKIKAEKGASAENEFARQKRLIGKNIMNQRNRIE